MNPTPYIKIYHNIMMMDIAPNEYRTYCAILRFMNDATNYANVSIKKLAVAVHLSPRCLQEKLSGLEARGLITVIKKHFQGHRISNGYLVAKQVGRFTMVPVDALCLPLTAFGFKVYTFLLKCADKHRNAFPSLTGIAGAIGTTLKTAITQIAELVALGLVKKRIHVKKDNSYGHNQYKLLSITNVSFPTKQDKEKTRPDSVFIPQHRRSLKLLVSILSNNKVFVKTLLYILHFCFDFLDELLFSFSGYCNFCRTSTRPISLYKRKINIKLYLQYTSKLKNWYPRK